MTITVVVYKKYVSEINKSQYKKENNKFNLGMNDMQKNEKIDKIKEMKFSLQDKEESINSNSENNNLQETEISRKNTKVSKSNYSNSNEEINTLESL